MYVWSKRLVFGLFGAFAVLFVMFTIQGFSAETSMLKVHTTRWITMNYAGLVIWAFVWMFDQAMIRGKNVWLWLIPYLFAPLPTLMVYVLVLQRKMKA